MANLMKSPFTIIFIAACALPISATAKNSTQDSGTSSCPLPAQVEPVHLYGLWRAEFTGLAQGATLLFEKHAERTGSVRGAINRNGVRALIAGDVDGGEFTLEESDDGVHISATWLGTVVKDSCGQEIRGSWSHAASDRAYPFVLRKLAANAPRQ
ncbi:MAG: hypothetical protein KBD82_20165 [Rhodoferax sp.]|nr:hypothetical protein [Rhodoferax sp.]